MQLAELAQPTTGTPQARLLELLDESAPLRLAGRFAALRAAAEDRERFDLEVIVTDESTGGGRRSSPSSSRDAAAPPLRPRREVEAFRRWLAEETVAQRRGARSPTVPAAA